MADGERQMTALERPQGGPVQPKQEEPAHPEGSPKAHRAPEGAEQATKAQRRPKITAPRRGAAHPQGATPRAPAG